MSKLRNQLEQLSSCDPCVHPSSVLMANICMGLLNLCDPINLEYFINKGEYLPRETGPFLYMGIPARTRFVLHSGRYYLLIYSQYRSESNEDSYIYFVFILRENGKYQFYQKQPDNRAEDWVRAPFLEGLATISKDGLISKTWYKRLWKVYQWCIEQGMPEINE